MPLDDLFATIRESCQSAVWSRGVETTRSARVLLESEDEEEIVLVIEGAANLPRRGGEGGDGGLLRVRLFPEDLDWSCSCEGEDPCAHAVAGAIAYRQAARKGVPLPKRAGGKAGHVGYRLRRTPQGLVLGRVIVQDSGETPLTVALFALTQGKLDGPNVEPTSADKKVEVIASGMHAGPLQRHVLPRLMDALSHCSDVRLDGEAVKASSSRSVLHGRITDHPEGFKLFVEQDPTIVEVFPGGVVLLESGVLEAVGETNLTGREIDELRRGRFFRREDATVLATEIVPSLAARIPFEVRTRRLPSLGGRAPVRIIVETGEEGDVLTVLPLLVYGDPPIARVDSGKLVPLGDTVPVRDMDEERALSRRLQAELGLEVGRKTTRQGTSALELLESLRGWRGEVMGSGGERFFRAPPLVPRVEIHGDDVSIEFIAHFTDGSRDSGGATESGDGGSHVGRASPSKVIAAWRNGESMVALDAQGLSPLPSDWLCRFGERVADLLSAKEACEGRLPPASLPDLAGLCEEMDLPPPPGFERLRDLIAVATSSVDGDGVEPSLSDEADSGHGPLAKSLLPAPELPPDLSATLRPYQYEGIRWLSFLKRAGLGALLADDMGLGKTLQTLCVIRGRTLVVAPASVIHNWADEIDKFRPALRHSIYHGQARRLDESADVVITTYALLRLDANLLSAASWDTVVLDEAQAIKNPDSQVARAAFRLPGELRIALTGTPVENRLEELWSQMHFVVPGLLGSRADFDSRYTRPIRDGEVGIAARLRARIRPFVLRRTKAAVAPELPARTDIVLRCSLSDSERAVYEAVQAAAREEVVGRLAAGGSVLDALEALLRMRQAACHPALVPGQEADTSAKVELLMETLEEAVAEGHKALVFSQWTSLLDLVEPHMEASGITFSRLDGSTRDRAAVVRGFQEETGPPVMLVSLRAGGTGLNLTAADHVFLLDPWWNPAVEDQAASRAHRIGQSRPVMVHRLVAEETVEEKILGLQKHKRALFEAALGEAQAAASLTRDDLLSLLQ